MRESQKLDMQVHINIYLHILGEKFKKKLSYKLKEKDKEISSKKEISKYKIRLSYPTANGQYFKRRRK